MRSFRSSLAALVLCLFGCDNDHYRSPQTCQLACERAAQCDRVPSGDCAAGCRGPSGPTPRLSKRYLDAVRRCLNAQQCSALGGPAVDVCVQDEALRLKPSKAAEDLCRRARDDERTCGRVIEPVSCLDDVKIYEDDDLRRVQRCFDGPCADHAACVRDTLGPAPYYPGSPY